MLKRVALVAVLCLASFAVLAIPGASAGKKAGTRLALTGYNPLFGGGNFTGTVSSKRGGCVDTRRVFMYKQHRGADRRVGSAKSGPNFGGESAFIVAANKTGAGKYYAKVRASKRCKADRSKSLRVTSKARAHKTKTHLVLSTFYASGGPGGKDLFIGEVKSSKTSCKNKRTITLYKAKHGNDQRIGSAKSGSGKGETYAFLVSVKSAKSGSYYAKTKSNQDCTSAKSNKLKVVG